MKTTTAGGCNEDDNGFTPNDQTLDKSACRTGYTREFSATLLAWTARQPEQ